MTSWYEQFDGQFCGCIPVPICPAPIRRRFSPFCRWVDVSPQTPQAYFRVASSVQHDSQTFLFTNSHVYLELRRKGMETLIATYDAWRSDANGNIGFYFDDTLFNEPSGFFIGDIFIDCNYCFSVQLRLAPCELVVTDCYVQPIMETCGRGECSVVDVIGLNTVGSLVCNVSTSSTCGPVPPYFELTNSALPPQTNTSSSGCTSTGFTPIG